jgi:hypothetical protein
LGAGDRVGLVGKTELEIYHAKMLAKILLLTQVFLKRKIFVWILAPGYRF